MRKYFYSKNVKLWNSLPSRVVNSCSVNSFKTNIDKCWRSQDVNYCDYDVILPELDTVVTVKIVYTVQ